MNGFSETARTGGGQTGVDLLVSNTGWSVFPVSLPAGNPPILTALQSISDFNSLLKSLTSDFSDIFLSTCPRTSTDCGLTREGLVKFFFRIFKLASC